MKSEQIDALAGALAKAQAGISDAEKTRKNPHLKNSYATLASVWDACREALTKNGLSVVQGPDGDVLVTTLAHASGQWVETRTPILYASQKGLSDAQAYGAALTYARRYALSAMVGVAQEDDDGQSAGRRDDTPRREPERRPEPAPAARQSEPRPSTGAAPATSLALAYIEAINTEAARLDAGETTAEEVLAYLADVRAKCAGVLSKEELGSIQVAWNALHNHAKRAAEAAAK